MKTFTRLYKEICSYSNLELAFRNARKGKTQKAYVIEFEANKEANLLALQQSLINQTYSPEPLKSFIVRDPKTRKISASAFQDRIVHHALVNILKPIYEPRFIFHSFANQEGKGTHLMIEHYERAIRKVGEDGWVLKADIKHYFDSVDHARLIQIVSQKIKDEKVIWLLRQILKNNHQEVGLPKGALTSQFLQNVFLNELDQFIKHQLKAKYYLRYVDDFVILSRDKRYLENCKAAITGFLTNSLLLELHPDKTRIEPIKSGITLLGFRIFPTHRLLKWSNQRRIRPRMEKKLSLLETGRLSVEKVQSSIEGWMEYARHASTYNLRKEVALHLAAFGIGVSP